MKYLLPLAAAVMLLTGCTRARVTTEIKSGGSYTRTLMFTGPEKKEGQMNMGESLEDVFVRPTTGWKSTSESKETNLVTTLTRTFPLTAASKGDLTIKEDSKPALVNEVTVTRQGPKRYEYRETLRWVGSVGGSGALQAKPEDLKKMKEALPPALATDANAKALTEKLGALALPMLFGPGDPLLTVSLIHPDLAGRRLSQRVGTLMIQALKDQFGDQLTADQRRQIVLHMVDNTLVQTKPTPPDPSAGPKEGNKNGGLVPLMFVLKTPGKIISHNGELDELAGEVFWALYPPAATLKPVVLTAVVEIE